ncbi:MAG: DNA-protecting protein DprA [Gemmatimonadaceae bacterium]|nr:DNA-protecting protein DprA [Gemmatimonadaceae bacterium]
MTGTVHTLRPGDGIYPAALRDLAQAPDPLYAIGDLQCLGGLQGQTVAIVGTRAASPYGLRVARAFAKALAESGALVVSGLARGIDSAVHEGALAGGGRTVAVLGTGPDVPYPARNRALHSAIVAHGLVVSENPPGRQPYRGCFPRRNRIIAALAQVTIVVEAPFKSGALNTATQALELGRTVAAVPGPIDHQGCAGSNMLLRDGAHVLASIADAFGLIGLSRNQTGIPPLRLEEAAVWDAVRAGGMTAAGVADTLDIPAGAVAAALARLELAGIVSFGADGTLASTMNLDRGAAI